ncbi:SOS response-associated peptidase [Novosphingobium sp. KA1]|uniref:SOS response-associated peptidase n=1 Tax=Novosphingobium sp. (strain KA1) TaxID=164608 RepID=UPI001A8DD4C5|nr:SOS response-associated peptidase family protein [Novosphingobium sp. KA1]QSR18391.1 hypothetical protein CA833_14545 [Novosphingobium sp. KA1]
MCNLYRMTAPADAVAKLLSAVPSAGANFAAKVYPKYTGLVVAQGAVRTMTWGFPRHAVSKRTGKPLKPTATNNARDDKLRGNPMWRDSFRDRRCLIPVTAWAEAEGPDRHMTRTWYSLPGRELFAVAGIWRPSGEWGEVYSMVMVPGSEQMSDVHDRMPTILSADNWTCWTDGAPDEAFSLLRTWDGPLAVDRTPEPWFKRSNPA